jgi:hypothetical protein
MSMAHEFYEGIFYPSDSPLFEYTDDVVIGFSCFAPEEQEDDYKGFLQNTAVLSGDCFLYA